jgi:hypothetical protein
MARNGYIRSSSPWDSRLLLAKVDRSTIQFDPNFVEDLQPALWIELATEYDAEHFCEYLEQRERGGTLCLSKMFSDFESVWRRDELNHTRGFAYIYSVLYSVSEEELLDRLSSRQPDFHTIEPLLSDEFAICVVLAYDEIATTKSYHNDMVHRYPKFGNPVLIDWIKRVAKDEAWHFENALNIIKANHAHRIPEVPRLLDALLSFDAGGEEYGATFVLDHVANNYTGNFLDSCRSLILERLGLTTE